MPPHKKWADAAEKQAAHRIRVAHPDWDDTQIRSALPKYKPHHDDRSFSHNAPPTGNDPLVPKGEPVTDITEDVWKACLIRLVNEANAMTPAIVDKIRDYLDKKDSIGKKPRPLLPPQESDAIGFSS